MDVSVPVLVLTGTIGVGKTAIAMTMSEILHDRGVRHGLLEINWLGEVYPAPNPDDPYSTAFAMKNLSAIWPHYLEVEITRAIVTMTIENHEELKSLETALTPTDVNRGTARSFITNTRRTHQATRTRGPGRPLP